MLHVGDGLAVAEVGRVCVVIWRDAVVRHRFEKQRKGLAEVVSNHPGQAGFLCIIEPSAKPGDDELRRASSEMVASHQDRLKCVACVIEGSGFKAAVGRSVLSGMALLLGNSSTPRSFFATVDGAVRWMAQHVSVDPVAQFSSGVDDVRRRLDLEQSRVALSTGINRRQT